MTIKNSTAKPERLLAEISHHAYCFIGGTDLSQKLEVELGERYSVTTKGNPDFWAKKYDVFTIEDARELKAMHETRPFAENGQKIFLLTANNLTIEAQNALLKLLEEPATYAKFFLIIPRLHLLLPTVKSRLQIIEGQRALIEANNAEAEKFLAMSTTQKMEAIKALVDDIAKEKKTKEHALEFVNNVEALIYSQKGPKNAQKELKAIQFVRKYINDRAPSIKMLLEYLVITNN